MGPGIFQVRSVTPQKSNESMLRIAPFLQGPVTFSKAYHFGGPPAVNISGNETRFIGSKYIGFPGRSGYVFAHPPRNLGKLV